MVEGRQSDASEVDMRTAINNTLRSIRGNSFAHFWTDGLVDNSEDAEQTRVIRRSVLIAVGRAFRKHDHLNSDIIWEEFRSATGLPIELNAFQFTLREFESRKVLEDERGHISAKVPLFQYWLKDKGVTELLGDARELQMLESRLRDEEQIHVSEDEISDFCDHLSQFRYRGRSIETTAIRKWLNQFHGFGNQRMMFRLLCGVRTYDETSVRAKAREAFGIVTREMHTIFEAGARVRNDILVSTLDESAAKAGLTYCRLFASENRVSAQSVQPLKNLRRRIDDPQNIDSLVKTRFEEIPAI